MTTTYRVVRAEFRRGLPLQGSSFVLSHDASTWYILREEQHDNSVTVAIADGPFPSRRSAERRNR